jgi:DUF4097 and DUF4098 domain-containing protein YvlB
MGRADWSDTNRFTTVNGSIVLRFPDSLNTEVRAATVNGDITSDFSVTTSRVSRRRLEGMIGAGGRTLALESVNGSITLKRE